MSTTVYSQVLIYTAESTGTTMERTKIPNLRNGSKGGFEPGLTRLRVRHSTTELPRSTILLATIQHKVVVGTDVNQLWDTFTDTLQESINNHIPQKIAKANDKFPWITK